jgi:hypothetical protein
MKNILGSNPFTSIAGYVVAGLMVVQTLITAGETDWFKIGIAAAIAVLGRVSGDSINTK